MGTTLNAADIARIEALLSRLDPDAQEGCRVPGCTHGHPDHARTEVLAVAA